MHVVVSPLPLSDYLRRHSDGMAGDGGGFDAIVCMGCDPRLGATAARLAAAGALASRDGSGEITMLYLEFALTDPDAVTEYQSIPGCEDGLSATLELSGEQGALHVRQLKTLRCKFG